MPSRKRAQGRARRARAAAPPGGGRADICWHGFASRHSLKPTQRQVIDTFAKEFNNLWSERSHFMVNVTRAMNEILEKHPEIFSSEESRTLIHSFMVSSGTEALLQHVNENGYWLRKAQIHACMLLSLEGCDFTKEEPFNPFDLDFQIKHRNVLERCKRSLVKFYRKRLLCSCLDELYAEVKPQPKTGFCQHCKQRFERRALKDCTGCNKVQYCSKECQKAAWPYHKKYCKEMRLL